MLLTQRDPFRLVLEELASADSVFDEYMGTESDEDVIQDDSDLSSDRFEALSPTPVGSLDLSKILLFSFG